MSSVLVKGMEMPANCQNCFASDDECRFCRAAKKYIPMLGKPKFCPLVELPDKHGDLIDRDEAYDCIAEQEGGNYVDMDTVGKGLECASTIVEAEDEP